MVQLVQLDQRVQQALLGRPELLGILVLLVQLERTAQLDQRVQREQQAPPALLVLRDQQDYRVFLERQDPLDPLVLRVLKALEERELCVCDLAHVLGISLSGTSQQLRELRRLGAVDFKAQGKLAYYRIADPFWLELADSVSEKLRGAVSS